MLILPMRLVENADSMEEAVKIACEHVLSQYKDVTFGPVFCARTGDGTLHCIKKQEVIEVYLGGKLICKAPILFILNAKPELAN